MAKIAISLDDTLFAEASRIAEEKTEGNFSALVADALRARIRKEVGLKLIAEYEAEYGAFTEEEMAKTREDLWPSKSKG